MTMSPGTPFAGSDVLFKVTGLEPWDVLEVEFLGPGGQAAPWITDEHYTGSWSNNYFLSDDDGSAQWVRYGAQDEVGGWSARIRIDDSLRIVNYSYTKFSLPRLVHARLGVPLFGCRSDEAVIFFSDSVNFAVTVDMHAELEFASDLLEERLGIRTAELPVIYLLGNQADFEAAQRASGKEPGWEAGFFRSYGEFPGIFVQSDTQQTDLYHRLAHEYIHFLLDEFVDGAELPAWLNEGLAEYYEYEVGRKGDRPDASYARMIRSVDQAKSAAAEGMLFRLSQLESQREWNGRAAELAARQYAQSHMAVRYLSETYGETVPIRIVTQVGSGASLADAIASVTGAAYAEMEADFIEWLKTWDDPDRAAAREYVQTLRVLADESEEILRLRGEANKEWSLHFDRVKFEKSAIEFRDRSKELVDRANLLRPHESVADLHTAATEFFLVFNE